MTLQLIGFLIVLGGGNHGAVSYYCQNKQLYRNYEIYSPCINLTTKERVEQVRLVQKQ